MTLNLLSLKKALLDIHLGSQIVKQQRYISTSAALLGKRNFRKFHLGNKRGTRIFKRDRNAGKYPDIPTETDVQPMGFKYGDTYHVVPEMLPQFVVPDLTGFELQPYVSYRTADIYQEPFTPEQLFQAVYEGKIRKDLAEGKLDENGNPKEPSPAESMSPDEAWIQARKSGSDIFSERIPKLWECLDMDVVEWDNKRKQRWSKEENWSSTLVEKKLTELE